MNRDPLDIVVIAPLRYPIRQPHAGGLEAAIWNDVRMLRRAGHRVRLIAVEGSDFLDGPPEFTLPALTWGDGDTPTDTDHPAGYLERAEAALDRALDLVAAEADAIDVIANHCLNPLPLRRAGVLGIPMISTLHTPVLPEFVHADADCLGERSLYLAVSEHTRAEWARVGITSAVLPNGIDVADWPLGLGEDGGLVWSGRLVPEKGPHLAIETARRLGLPLTIVGRVGDPVYAAREVFPLIGDGIRYLGELSQPALAALVGRSAVALVTPVWQEPFGLVVPEALLCGTPVAAFDVGGIAEIARTTSGVETVPVGDVEALAAAVAGLIASTDRRRRAELHDDAARSYSLEGRRAQLEAVFRSVSRRERAA